MYPVCCMVVMEQQTTAKEMCMFAELVRLTWFHKRPVGIPRRAPLVHNTVFASAPPHENQILRFGSWRRLRH